MPLPFALNMGPPRPQQLFNAFWPADRQAETSYVHEPCLSHPTQLQTRRGHLREPVLFTSTERFAGFNETCRLRRHLFYYGKRHLPLAEGTPFWGAAGPSRKTLSKTHLLTVAKILPVTEVSTEVDVDTFARRLEPFVIRGGGSELPAMQRWSDEYLASQFRRSPSKYRPWFDEALQDCCSQTYGAISLQRLNRSTLLSDARIPRLYQHEADNLERVTFWYTARGLTRSKLHRDDGNFVIVQVAGTKTFSLVDPAHSLRLYADWSDLYNLSPVDPTNVRLDLYPDVEDVPVKVVRLHAGDMLYLPIDTWHFVESGQGRNNMLTFQFRKWDFEGLPSHYSVNFTAFLDQYRRRKYSTQGGAPRTLRNLTRKHRSRRQRWRGRRRGE